MTRVANRIGDLREQQEYTNRVQEGTVRGSSGNWATAQRIDALARAQASGGEARPRAPVGRPADEHARRGPEEERDAEPEAAHVDVERHVAEHPEQAAHHHQRVQRRRAHAR